MTVTTAISARQENHGPDLVSSVNTPYPHHGWIPAKQLKPGEPLKTADGTLAIVVGGSTPKVHDGWMWDITVPGNNDHDFYVTAGTSDILVHNQSCTFLSSQSGKDTIAVIGARGDTLVAGSWDGHEILDLPDYSEPKNEKWIEGVIQKKQAVYLGSEINDVTLSKGQLGGETQYAKELNQLLKGGYTFTDDGQYMIPG